MKAARVLGSARPQAVALCVGAALAACHERSASAPPTASPQPSTVDRLAPSERLPEAETAFGVPLPAGMRLVRHFDDTAYFSGEVPLDRVVEHLQKYVRARDVQALGKGVLFARALVAGDDARRLLRIEVRPTGRNTQLHIQDITPPPALTGANDAEIWRKAGRNADGTPIDQNAIY